VDSPGAVLSIGALLGAVAALELLAAPAPAGVVAADLVLVINYPLLNHRRRLDLLALAETLLVLRDGGPGPALGGRGGRESAGAHRAGACSDPGVS